MDIREPAVAGAFYPGEPKRLERAVEGLLAEVVRDRPEAAPKALIVPHAGYVYSGPVAASAYARLAPLRTRVTRVVLLGPAHRVPVRGLALLPLDAMRTPLGLVPVDRDAASRLRDLSYVDSNELAHAAEHSLEVQLPFLQSVLDEFSVVPIVVGEASDDEVAEVLERLWGGDETIIVISSDLSHYLDDATARALDARTCQAIEGYRAEALDRDSACGRVPVRGLLRVARRRNLEVRTLDLRNSGDTAGSRDAVVGYGAWAFSPPSRIEETESEERKRDRRVEVDAEIDAETNTEIDAEADARLLEIARESIVHGLRAGRPVSVDTKDFPAPLREPGASFVTLRAPDGSLRGCIGSLEPRRALVEDVAENAWAAASRDTRFRPVEAEDLPELRIHVSVLGPPQPLDVRSRAELVASLRAGRDGLILEDGGHRATFLPQVWESVRDGDEFVRLLWQKAGLRPDHWSATVRAYRYETRSIDEP